MKQTKEYTSQLEKLLGLPDSRVRLFGRWLTIHLSYATAHLPNKEEFLFKVWRTCVGLLVLLKVSQKHPKFKGIVLSTLVSRPKSKWTIFLDKLSSSNNSTDHVTLATELLQILLQESISREKVYKPFWTPAYLEISKRLLLPTGTDFASLDSISSSNWSQELVGKSRFLQIKSTKLVNKSLLTTSSPSSTCFPIDKWESEVIQPAKLKTLKLRILPNLRQKKLLDGFIHTFRYVYNRSIEFVNDKKCKANFYDLRDLLVTGQTKKGCDEYAKYDEDISALRRRLMDMRRTKVGKEEIDAINGEIKEIVEKRRNAVKKCKPLSNPLIRPFELETPKDIRAAAVKRCCDAMKSGFTNLRNGNIKHFRMKFAKRTEPTQTMELTPKLITITANGIKICPETFGKDDCFFKIHKGDTRKIQNIQIKHNVDVSRTPDGYFLYIPIETTPEDKKRPIRIGGVDLGVRTLASVHINNIESESTTFVEYEQRQDVLRKLNKKIAHLKTLKVRKRHLKKRERKKKNLVDKMHWDFINDLLKRCDVVYIGDIKSQSIVKKSKNSTLNQDFNDLKFFQLKNRLIYKGSVKGKLVYYGPENHTTKTCSSCGQINNHVGASKVFKCNHCQLVTGRDMNAAKNIKMKGMLSV